MKKVISYRMAPPDSYYQGQVMRLVTGDLEGGVFAILSETTTGMELPEFQKTYPGQPVDGQSGGTIAHEIRFMNDEQLADMGLRRVEGVEQETRPSKVVEVLEPKVTYPAHQGYGWWLLSNGNKVKGKADATHRQAMIDAGTPEPEDEEL